MNLTPLQRLALQLDADLESEGRDLPSRLYAITGSVDDPTFIKLAEFTIRPEAMLARAWHEGHRVPPGSIGIALATEGWRTPNWDDLNSGDPAVAEGLTALGLTLDQVLAEGEEAWIAKMEFTQPSRLPPGLCIEIRSVAMVLRRGFSEIVLHDQGRDPLLTDMEGVLRDELLDFLRGRHPRPR